MSPEAAAASGAGLQKHWTGLIRSPLLVHFKLSNSRQQIYGVIIRKTVLRNTDWVNLWMNLERSVTKQCCYVSAFFLKWLYANPWPSLVGIPAYHIDYTTDSNQSPSPSIAQFGQEASSKNNPGCFKLLPLRVTETTRFCDPSNKADVFYSTLPQMCDPRAWFLFWYALSAVWNFIKTCVPFQIIPIQLNLPQVTFTQSQGNCPR